MLTSNTSAGEVGLGIIVDANEILVQRNTVTGARSMGIVVGAFRDHVTLDGNTSSGNDGHGIWNEAPPASIVLRNNRALGHLQQGIVSTATATDGGGNRATGNLFDPQCENVACA